MNAPISRALGVLLALLALAPSSCVRVTTSYRDVGVDSPELPDVPRPDAPLPDAPVDAMRPDVPPMDAPLGDTPLSGGDDATREVLASIGENVILPDLRQFETDAVALEAALGAAVASGSPSDRAAAQAAWRAAMRTWERVEAVQLGPAGLASVTLGGSGLRDEIYSWPFVSYCRMDIDTEATTHADLAQLRAEAISARGLATIEYVLFREDAENACEPTATLNTSGAWAALGAGEIARRRLVYAHNAAILVVERARELRMAWEPSGGNFLGALATAGAGSTVYTTAQAGLNGMSDALFYLYKEVVDLKLGIPAGLRIECTTATCPEHVESPWADASLDHIRTNVEAFRDLYLGAPPGTDAPGFDDLLRSLGATDLDLNIRTQIDVALAAIDPVTFPLEVAVDTDHADVVTLHDAILAFANLFKVDVLTLLNLELPNRLEGDND